MDISPLYQVIISVVVLFGTQAIKKIQAIPINDGQKTRIRTFVGITTFVLTGVTAWLDGRLEDVIGPEVIEVGLATGISWLLSELGYRTLLNKK